MKEHDYLVFQNKTGTSVVNCLGRVVELNPLRVQLEPQPDMSRPTVEIEREQVLALLGSHPHPGTCFSLDLHNIYRTAKPNGNFGSLHFYVKPDEETRRCLKAAFSLVNSRLTKTHTSALLDDDITFCIMSLKGKYAGMYKFNKKLQTSRIEIDPSKTTGDDLPLTIAHELGHHLWTKLDKDTQSEWAKVYMKYVRPRSWTSKQVAALKESLQSSGQVPSEFAKTLESDDDQLLLKRCLAEIKKGFKLGNSELNTLWETDSDTLLELWPTSMKVGEYEPVVSEYATKNYRELFAESFAFWLNRKQLPKTLNKMVEVATRSI